MELKEKLQEAYAAVQNKNTEEAAEAVEALKVLPRTAEGVFDLSSVDGDCFAAAGLAYPVYVAYETVCNKKEGYPDLIVQMRAWNKLLKDNFTLENAAKAADMWIHTIAYMSPEIYEYYRELCDIFKKNVRETLERYYAAGKPEGEAAELFKKAVLQACEADILLAEKYENRV